MTSRLQSVALLVVLGMTVACARAVVSPALSSAPPEEVLESLRTIAVIAGANPREATFPTRVTTGQAARMGAVEGAKETFQRIAAQAVGA